MNLSPKRIAKIVAWINFPLLLIALFVSWDLLSNGGSSLASNASNSFPSPWDFASNGDSSLAKFAGILIFLGIIIGVLYFVLAYSKNFKKDLSALFWISSIAVNILFICGLMNTSLGDLSRYNEFNYLVFIFFIYPVIHPVIILILSLIALIKVRKGTA